MEKEKRTCWDCSGIGTKTEQDFVMGIVMGDLLNTGYFPQTKTVTCHTCNGTGKIDK